MRTRISFGLTVLLAALALAVIVRGTLAAQRTAIESIDATTMIGPGVMQHRPLKPSITPTIEFAGQVGGAVVASVISGTRAYVSVGPRIVVLDVSTPNSITVVGRSPLLPAVAYDLVVRGQYVYLPLGSNGLHILDVGNPNAPIEIGSLALPGFAYRLAVSGTYAYVATEFGGLRIVNITSPDNPAEVGSIAMTGIAYSVAVDGHYAYIGDGIAGMRVIDVSTPTAPTEVGAYDTPDSANGLVISGSYAYVTDGHLGRLIILNISNPLSPTLAGSMETSDTTEYSTDVVVSGTTAYMRGDDDVHLINVSNPANPIETGIFVDAIYPWHVAIAGSTAYIAEARGLRLYHLPYNSGNLSIGAYVPDQPRDVQSVAVSADGHYAYVTDAEAVLHVVDVSNSATPSRVGRLLTNGGGGSSYSFQSAVAISGTQAFVALGGLRIVDVSNPNAPQALGSTSLSGVGYDIALDGSHAYVAASSKIHIFDASNPVSPSLLSSITPPCCAYGVAVSSGRAYVADGNNGLRIYDVTNPVSPTELGSLDTPGYARKIAVRGSLAYIADRTSLRIVDVSNPVSLTQTSYISATSASDVALVGHYAYLTGGFTLSIVDVGNPAAPVEVAHYSSRYGYTLVIAGDYIYTTGLEGGLNIFRVHLSLYSVFLPMVIRH